MSLIVARKDGHKIGIVSDTKLTYPNHETKNLKTSPKDGVVKTVILSENLCVSFAGEIEPAELALKEINNSTDTNSILHLLEKYHHLSKGETEFIFCIGKPDLTMYEIKNGIVQESNQSWIGDKDAFDKFQKSIIAPPTNEQRQGKDEPTLKDTKTNQPSITITEMNLTFEVSQNSSILSKLSSAMDNVIENDSISSVGGFKVNVIYDNKFIYNGYIKNYRQNVTMTGIGSQVIGHGTAQDGSYSINFIGCSSDYKSVALHVSQGNFGIVYTRTDYGLLKPVILNFDEVDFSDEIQDKYNITSSFSTQDRVQKYFTKASNLFHQKNYRQSEIYFDKGFNAANGAEKAKFLFNKGLLLLSLKDKTPAMKAFSETVKIDPTYTTKILNVLHPKR